MLARKSLRWLSGQQRARRAAADVRVTSSDTTTTTTPPLPSSSEWSRLKQVARTYGSFFSAYNSALWWLTGVLSIGSMELFSASEYVLFALPGGAGEKARELMSPMFANLVMGLVFNECIEPVRFPLAALTVPRVHTMFQPMKEE